MWRSNLKWMPMMLLAASLTGAAFGTTSNSQTAVPGTVNYVEGQVSLNGETINTKSIGSAELAAGQSMNTQTGKAEFLLTPGVYVRLGDNSQATLVSPSLTSTKVSIDQGEAMVEVDELHKQNDLRIVENGTSTELVKPGLYAFNAANDTVRVFDGKAIVQENEKQVGVKGGHEFQLNTTGKLKAVKFDKKAAESNDLYRWSSLRSDYLAEANLDAAHAYIANGWYGPGWIGAGWYWDPWLAGYTFLPGNGFLYSPFGWGFYSPLWVYRSPLWFGAGYYANGRPGYVTRAPNRGAVSEPTRGTVAPRAGAWGFHSGFRGETGGFHGGFRGGMGGFHGTSGFSGGTGFGGRR